MPTPQELAMMGAPPGGNPPMGTGDVPMPDGITGMPPMQAQQGPMDFSSMMTPEKKGFGRIAAEALGAGLAGWGGTGEQYLGRMDDLDLKRRQAMISDGWKSYKSLRTSLQMDPDAKNRPTAADALWSDRVNILNGGGRDASESSYIRQQLRDDPQGVAEGFRTSLVQASEANDVDIPSWAVPTDLDRQLMELYPNDPAKRQSAKREAIENKLKINQPSKGTEVQSVMKLPNGGFVAAMKDGSRIVRNAEGDIVKGKEAAKMVRDANLEDAALQGRRAGERRLATVSADQALAAFKSVAKARKNIANYDRAISAIDEGAKTGVITRMFKSFRESTIRLEQAGRELGLDVIGSVTFGALSEGELNLAMDTAMPTNLAPPELRKWLVERRDAQRKLAGYFEDAGVYLGTPGNTIATWIASGQMKALETQDAPPNDIADLLSKYGN